VGLRRCAMPPPGMMSEYLCTGANEDASRTASAAPGGGRVDAPARDRYMHGASGM
jgi:hypothetical protein